MALKPDSPNLDVGVSVVSSKTPVDERGEQEGMDQKKIIGTEITRANANMGTESNLESKHEGKMGCDGRLK